MSDVPRGWIVAPLVKVCELIQDCEHRTPKYSDAGVPALRPRDVVGGRLNLEAAALVPQSEYELQTRRYAPAPGDVAYSRELSLGWAVKLPAARVCLSQGMVALKPGSVAADYLVHFLNGPGRAHAVGAQAGSAHPHLNLRDIRAMPLPVAPLAEQERIITAVEEAFSKLDAGEAGLRTVRQLLKRMREAVLAAAVTGRLVPQGPSDTATKLFVGSGRELPADAELSELPDGWRWSTLGGVSLSDGYGSSVKCGYDAGGVGVLRIPNIQDGRVDLGDLKRAPEGSIPDALMLAPGDLLIVRTNGSRDLIGRSAPVTRDTGCSFASYLIRFRLNSAVVDGGYVSLMLSSSTWRRRLEASAASSAGQYNLSLRTLEPMPVAVPPLAEQREIVAEVDRQLYFVQACERAVDSGLARATALRRSVLKAAFEGQLVPQDPSDEPASVLLERIHAERSAADEILGGRRRKKVGAS